MLAELTAVFEIEPRLNELIDQLRTSAPVSAAA